MTSGLSPTDEQANLPVVADSAGFSSVLLRIIEATRGDPAQLRSLVYELARQKLKKEAFLHQPTLNVLEFRRQLNALESAIKHVESVSSHEDRFDSMQPRHEPAVTIYPAARERPPVVVQRFEPPASNYESFSVVSEVKGPSRHAAGRNRVWALARSATQLLVVALLVAVISPLIYGVLAKRMDFLSTQPSAETKPTPSEAVNQRAEEPPIPAISQVRSPGIPLPSTYGVYVVSHDRLSMLEQLPIRVPDPRVSIGPAITSRSQITLPDGKAVFIVYRRDLVTHAPEKASIRVLARVARTMSFNSGRAAVTTEVDDTWVVRNKSYEFGVSPVEGNQEMIMIKPETDSFSLPPGRYALVVGTLGYDFTVEGKSTDLSQCLERVEGANGNFYSECRLP